MALSRPVSRSTGSGYDVEGQTRYLFHRYVAEVTGDSGTVNSRAFQEMNNMDARVLFGTDSAALDALFQRLRSHVMSFQNDSVLQGILGQLRDNFNSQSLWSICQRIFNHFDDIWSALLTLFAFGVELCRQIAVILMDYDTIVTTIVSAVMRWASDWIINNGGWMAVVPSSGVLTAVANAVSSWVTWLLPSSSSSSSSNTPPSSTNRSSH
ncbi:uncharacterized protein LOC143301249 [Babylonia areolata]|uniref:uncharacterized protein LOC143301249 n=1 Tax=Babylonia areolata TaxID=304850 RepID=UPI003FD0FEB2